MKPSFRLSAMGRRSRILLAVCLVLVAMVALFDWNWFRPPIERYLSDKSGREVRLGDLHVALGFSLEPTIRLRGVYIENAPWAAKRPLVTAGELSFTVSLKSVWQGRPIISKLVLVDADIDMERQADGLRNWRLKNPEDRSPGTVRVQILEAHRSQVRLVNRGIDLDFTASAAPAASNAGLQSSGERRGDSADAQPGKSPRDRPTGTDELTTRISYKGTYEGVSFTGEALSTGLLSFRESGYSFPLRGHLTARKTRVDYDGFFTDVFDLGPMDAKVRVAGPTLAYVHPFLRIRPPESRPFKLEAQLTQTNHQYKFARLRGNIGDTDIAGEATYDRSKDRPLVLAELRSESGDLADLSVLVGLRYAPRGAANAAAKTSAKTSAAADSASDEQQPADRAEAQGNRTDRVLPTRPFHLDKLRAVDARVKLTARKLKADNIPMLESLSVVGDLSDGVLELKPIDVGVSGGHIAGVLGFNARRELPAARATLELRDIRLDKLAPLLSSAVSDLAPIRGQIALTGEGKSIASVLGNSSGSIAARIDGGRISNLADAKLGLNIGKVLSLMIRGDREIPVHCGAVAFDVRNGVGKSRVIVLDTEQTRTDGVGTLDLREERWDIVLTPQPKNPGFLTRRASIRLQGTFRNVDISIQERIAIGRAGGSPESVDPSKDKPCTEVVTTGAAEKGKAKARTQ
ncbi:MAG: AsmA family protein [Burkholderiales bacterium]